MKRYKVCFSFALETYNKKYQSQNFMKIPFLKPGTYNAVGGKEVTFSEDDLNEIVTATQNRNYQNDSIPIVIGHPKIDSPAWGWIKKDAITNTNNILVALAENENLNEDFISWFKKKLYTTVSAKIRKDKSIAHIGFLGAQPPAVAGLPAVALSENDEDILCEIELADFEASGWGAKAIGRLLRNIKLYFAEKEGADKANTLLPEYDIEEAATAPRIWQKDSGYKFNESEEQTKIIKLKEEEEMKELDDAKTQLAEKDTALIEANAKLKAFEDKQKADALAAKKNEFVAFCESDEVKVRIKDGEKDSIVETLLALDAVEAFEFGEGDSKQTVAPVDVVKNLISRLPNVVPATQTATTQNAADDNSSVELAEFSGKNVDTERLELHKKAIAIQKAESIPYAEALKKVK